MLKEVHRVLKVGGIYFYITLNSQNQCDFEAVFNQKFWAKKAIPIPGTSSFVFVVTKKGDADAF